MDGGKYLGEGSYGCAFRPALPCRDEKTIGPDGLRTTLPSPVPRAARATIAAASISKVFKRTDALLEELQIVRKLADLDPKQKYFVYARTVCETTPADLRTDPEHRSCRLLGAPARARSRAYPTLKIPFGGRALDDVLGPSGRAPPRAFRAPDPLRALITALRPVLLGLGRLADAGLLHHDVKMDNILYDATRHECRLIDFGLSIRARDALSPDGNPFLFSDYIFHPPEYRIAAALHLDPIAATTTPAAVAATALATDLAVLKTLVPGLKAARATETLRDRLFNPIYTNWTRDSYTDAFNHYAARATRAATSIAPPPWSTSIRADVWGLGVMLLFILHRVWPTRTTPLPDPLRAVLTHMLHPDPHHRLSPKKLTTALSPWIVGDSHLVSVPATAVLTAPPPATPPLQPPPTAVLVSSTKPPKRTTPAAAPAAPAAPAARPSITRSRSRSRPL